MKRANAVGVLLLLAGCTGIDTGTTPSSDVEEFLRMYNQVDRRLYAVSAEANWKASTDVRPLHIGQRIGADEALAAFRGSPYVIESSRGFLDGKEPLDTLAFRQLDKILLNAAETPGTIPEVVERRIETEARLSGVLDGFTFCVERRGEQCVKAVTPNEIDALLRNSTNLAERRSVWEISKQTGPPLKDGLAEVRDLRNMVARQLGYSSYFHLQVADYGMSVEEMLDLMDGVVRDVQPLYTALHQWTRRRLAERYGQAEPEKLPAHWVGSRWGESWPGLVEAADLDPLLRDREPEWIVKQAERFYTSIGMEALPDSFWEKSDLYQFPPGANRRKNAGASAWQIDRDRDVRCLMSVVPDFRWFTTVHYELGHVYYYLAYSRPEVPPVLREGMNRAFHEAVGDLIAMVAGQEPYLRAIGVVPRDRTIDPTEALLNEGLNGAVVSIPFSAGVMTHFEHDLYEDNLDIDEFNAKWWERVDEYQAIVPPAARGEEYCDGCTKSQVIDDPARYYDRALGYLIMYQLHDYIARQILHQDPHRCNYYGNEEVGEWLMSMMRLGATRDWREVLREATGEEISTRAMLEYFQPLREYLDSQ